MTFRARTGPNRPRTWDERDRRTFLLNVGFGLTVVAALLLLLIAFGLSWYGDHLASAATVNGQSISKDAYSKQLAVNIFRIDYQQRRIRTLLTAGRIRTTDAENRLSVLQQYTQQAGTIALEQLIDGRIMDELAAREGVTVSQADVDAKVTEEATTPELRRAWVIAVEPNLAEGESTPNDTAKAAAKAKAQQALTDLRTGKDWETVAKAVSTDATRDQAGDLGFIDENASLDEAFVDALVAVAKDTPTDVIEGEDGIYRVGRVTEIIDAVVDATLEQQVQGEGVALEDFRAAMRREALRDKLDEALLARVLAAGPQRQVQEIFLEAGTSETGPSAVRVRHILYSPNGDPQGAASLAEDDPAWAEAKAKADAAYQKLRADISQFDAIARAESDEGLAETSGGKLPYFSTEDPIDPVFAAAIFAPGLKEGQLLEPVKSSFGWHVIQVQRYPPDLEWANKLKAAVDGGEDFSELARDNSDNAEAAEGGDIGWIGKGQLGQEIEDAIFATPVGAVSQPLVIEGEGIYLFKVTKEETREPDAEQRAQLEASAFSTWYSREKAGFTIERSITTTPITG
jgi:peptidyl-prolyl cis-trans isomerase C